MNSTSLTPLEVAELLKITKNTVYELIKRGELPAYKVGRKLRIDKEDIDNYIKSQKSSTISSPDTQQQEITLNDIPSEKNETKLDDKSIIICGQDMILDILSFSGKSVRKLYFSLSSLISCLLLYICSITLLLYSNGVSSSFSFLADIFCSKSLNFIVSFLSSVVGSGVSSICFFISTGLSSGTNSPFSNVSFIA